ncbi:hypothetical protein BGZ82_008666 [Podila clonocystis]|nr:hypothetical protein BGZ82_008666 [Podila clonocystis]
MENLSDYERARLQSIEDNKAKLCDLFGFLEPAKVLMRELVPVKPLSTRSTPSHRAVSRDQPDQRLYSAREVEQELRRDPARKYEAACVIILRRSRRTPRVNYSLKRLWSDDDDEYGRPLKKVLGASWRKGPIDSGRGKRNCSFCRPKKGLPSTGLLSHKAQKGGYYSVSHYLGDVIVNDDGTWTVAPQAAKFRYREKGDVSEDEQAEEDPEEVDELADDESEKADDSGRDEEEEVDELADDENEKADDSGRDEEEEVDELAEEEDMVDDRAEDENAPVKNTKSPNTATKEDAKAENILQARKTDANTVPLVIIEKSAIVEGKEDKAKAEMKNKVSN